MVTPVVLAANLVPVAVVALELLAETLAVITADSVELDLTHGQHGRLQLILV
jgi:hypothetical protein